ncbi:MAG: hypothetical protein DMG88_17570 [Acidobacteria bacterium]|nr:MAG: hypothetical protein DMG88_17570 [Acidobacteriota bacterium]
MILEARLVETKRNCCFVRCCLWKALWKRVFEDSVAAKLMPFVLLASLAVLFLPWPPSVFAAAPVSSPLTYDSAAEQKLLDLANQARVQAGLAPLHPDDGLTEAAREHAAAIAERQQLSHQLPGEAPLAQRLATSTNLHLERGGENVATAATVDQIYASLMRSAPHRENLLNPSFNVAGFGVVRNGYLLFVTQDFGEGRETYSAQTSEDLVAASVTQKRQQQRRSSLLRLNSSAAQAAACSMARANSLITPMSRDMAQSRYLLRYTSNQPQNLPSSAPRAIGDRNISAFAVGSCYAKTTSYPNGVYWVALMFY